MLSSVSQSNCDSDHEFIVAIPDTLDDEEMFLRKLVELGVLPNSEPSSVSFVYYSWVIDSICADVLAPLNVYRPEFCLKEE